MEHGGTNHSSSSSDAVLRLSIDTARSGIGRPASTGTCLEKQGTPLALHTAMKRQVILNTFLASFLVIGGSALGAQQTPPPRTPPDNTKVNKQPGPTADQQSQAKADLALAKSIRQTIVKDKTLSTTAHNSKVIVDQGAVTLRGPVNSTKEKARIEEIAVKAAGTGKVTNELTIKATKSGKSGTSEL